MNTAVLSLGLALGGSSLLALSVFAFMQFGVPRLKKMTFKRHVNRTVDGRFLVVAWTPFGKTYLKDAGFRQGEAYEWGKEGFVRQFRTLEDATQAYEVWEEAYKSKQEAKAAAKAAAGVVHRF